MGKFSFDGWRGRIDESKVDCWLLWFYEWFEEVIDDFLIKSLIHDVVSLDVSGI